jgi:hypothetical protein
MRSHPRSYVRLVAKEGGATEMMTDQTFVIRFDVVSQADASVYAEDLRRDLIEADSTLRVERKRDHESAMDFGATLILVLGTPSIVIAAKAISKWLVRNNSATITLETKDGKLIGRNLNSKDVSEILKNVPFSRND